MKKIFNNDRVSDRLHNENLDLEEKLIREDFHLFERAQEKFSPKQDFLRFYVFIDLRIFKALEGGSRK